MLCARWHQNHNLFYLFTSRCSCWLIYNDSTNSDDWWYVKLSKEEIPPASPCPKPNICWLKKFIKLLRISNLKWKKKMKEGRWISRLSFIPVGSYQAGVNWDLDKTVIKWNPHASVTCNESATSERTTAERFVVPLPARECVSASVCLLVHLRVYPPWLFVLFLRQLFWFLAASVNPA